MPISDPKHVSDPQLYALHLACHYKLKRSSMGWWPENHPRWGRTEIMKILSPQTIKSLLKMRLLNGTPDGSNPELWTNERGRTVLDQIRCDTGIFFDVSNDQLICPELNDVDSGESQAIHKKQ